MYSGKSVKIAQRSNQGETSFRQANPTPSIFFFSAEQKVAHEQTNAASPATGPLFMEQKYKKMQRQVEENFSENMNGKVEQEVSKKFFNFITPFAMS